MFSVSEGDALRLFRFINLFGKLSLSYVGKGKR
jgi:hypothetical protein